MSISSEIIVKAFIKMANKNFLDAYLINKGNNEAGEIFLKVSNLKGYSMLYSYRKSNINKPWEIYGKESWQNEYKSNINYINARTSRTYLKDVIGLNGFG